jgi:predicted nucleic acid binding AN1-type Zn finger protein
MAEFKTCPRCNHGDVGTYVYKCPYCGAYFCAICRLERANDGDNRCPQCRKWTGVRDGAKIAEMVKG